ncbi:MAG: HAD-IA family hydrolase [Corallococcus sp.]|nr:HAD-IA family hydrolase [Corallococcus sp.]MCM1358967.1 HAD-IA family hydrolase [Corallococcus sp.]MCM1394956.1 HAD-IA family hydrolase [Corallococcus sp.]
MKNLYIFDCFGVVVTDVSTLWMQNRLSAEQQQSARINLFRKVDCGLMPFEDCLDALAKTCRLPLDEVRAQWDILAKPMPQTLRVITELRRRGHTVALLSNAASEYIDRLFSQFELYGYFDKIFVSANYGYAKPDREFYRICLDSFSQKFGKIYFTDDNPDNLQNLQEFGITPVLFRDADQLERDFGLD